MNFWARKAAEQAAQQRPPAARNAVGQGPWWRDTVDSRAVEDVPLPPPPQDDGTYVPTVPLQQKTGTCPGCSGTNYMQVNGSDPRARFPVWQCFECGYPVQHTTSGMNSTGQSGQGSTPSRQISQMTVTNAQGRVIGTTDAAAGVNSNYHPQDTQAGRIA